MSLKRVFALLAKEITQGPKGIMFIMAIAVPIIMSMVVSLVFGTWFNDTPSLGIVDQGNSRLISIAGGYPSISVVEYETEDGLRQAVESGKIDAGMVLPSDFDDTLKQNRAADVTVYIWGEGQAENFGILEINLFGMMQELAGQETPVNIETITLGEGIGVPWNDRLLPFIVLMAVVFAAVILPAMAVVAEKEKKTLAALAATPATLGEIFISKGIIGAALSLFMGIVTLIINNAFGLHPVLLVMVLGLGAVMGTFIGLLAGALIKDINSLLAFTKAGGILLYAPTIVYMFPQIPQWVGKVFPTYYIIEPVVELVQRGGGWPDIAVNVFILVGLIVLLAVLLYLVLRIKTEQQFAL
ncbi:MAG: ABC transporter permease [Dehalococcoidia bacterium]|nr:ABC transporter permease [Dehalococcoidia bacterium]